MSTSSSSSSQRDSIEAVPESPVIDEAASTGGDVAGAAAVNDNAQGPLLASSEEQTTLSVKTKRYVDESADDGPFGNWFRKHRMHVIVFTYSGKPVYTRYGSPDGVSAFCGALAAIVSKFGQFYHMSGGVSDDSMRSISTTGGTRFVFLDRTPLWLVAVCKGRSTTHGKKQAPLPIVPLAQLRSMLNAVYRQLITVLTSQVERMLLQRPSYDARALLGGTESVLENIIRWSERDLITHCDDLSCFEPLPLSRATRDKLTDTLLALKPAGLLSPHCFSAMILGGHRVAAMVSGPSRLLKPCDMPTFINLTIASGSLRSGSSWSPVCLPAGLDRTSFVYSYVQKLSGDVFIVFLCASPDSDTFYTCQRAADHVSRMLTPVGIVKDVQLASDTAPISIANDPALIQTLGDIPMEARRYSPAPEGVKILEKVIHVAMYLPASSQLFSSRVDYDIRGISRGHLVKEIHIRYGQCVEVMRSREKSSGRMVAGKKILLPQQVCLCTTYECFLVWWTEDFHMYLTVPMGTPTSVITHAYQWILGPIWAAVASDFDYQFCKNFTRKAVAGVWVGATTGALVHYLISIMSGTYGNPDEYPRLWAVFLQLPFTFIFCMARGKAGCKLSDVFFGQHALIVSSIPTEFFTVSAYGEDLVYAVSGTVGLVLSFVLITLLKLLHWLPVAGLPPFEQFSYQAAAFYDVLTSYANSGKNQQKIIDATYKDFVKACVGITKGAGGPKEIYGPAWQMAGFLFSLRQVELRGCYSDFIMEHYWDPLASEIFKLRSNVGAVLRNLYDANADSDILSIDLRARSRILESKLLQVDNMAERGYMEGRFTPPKSSEFMRFQFMIGSIMFFAVRAEEFKEAVLEHRKGDKSKKSKNIFRVFFEDFVDFWKTWWKKPFFSRTAEEHSIQPQLMFALRFTLAIVVASVVLIIGGWYSYGVYRHARWAIVPLYVCFMPTVGSSILRGTRRVLGTMAGAALGMICIVANSHDRAAVFVEAMVVGFVGKLASIYPPIEYAGRQFMNTWYVVCLDLALSTTDTKREMVIAAAWRVGLTTGGILYCTILSGTLFPEFASNQMRLRAAHAISRAGEGVERATNQLVASRESEDEAADVHDCRPQFGTEVFDNMRTVMACKGDASAEVVALDHTMLIPDMSKRVYRNMDDILRLTRYSLVLHNALVSTTLRVSGRAVEILDPIIQPLQQFSAALDASRSHLVEVMVKPEKENLSPPPLDDINVTMQECVDAFLAARRDLVKDALSGSDRAIEVTNGGGFRVYHLVYALSVFADFWTDVETELIGRLRPCEMIRLSTDAGQSNLIRTMSSTRATGTGQ
ncbi:Golgi transport complex subunit 3 [Perkinsus chesapeaki]|uniref:Golgi transport complex subunit 3 n=1 Tax=Perkinsus chesapeaki TaxID=330153 RepID=A0A7J6N2A8_PERCH|nr:Golgi transport complex subunit 3 [Perkinsus chesapeaki]